MARINYPRTNNVGQHTPYNFTASTTSIGTGVRVGDSTAKTTSVGTLVVGDPGTTMVITLYNGDPTASGVALYIIKPTAVTSLNLYCEFSAGLWVKATGTVGNVTINYIDGVNF